jgi:hypothetical protein
MRCFGSQHQQQLVCRQYRSCAPPCTTSSASPRGRRRSSSSATSPRSSERDSYALNKRWGPFFHGNNGRLCAGLSPASAAMRIVEGWPSAGHPATRTIYAKETSHRGRRPTSRTGRAATPAASSCASRSRPVRSRPIAAARSMRSRPGSSCDAAAAAGGGPAPRPGTGRPQRRRSGGRPALGPGLVRPVPAPGRRVRDEAAGVDARRQPQPGLGLAAAMTAGPAAGPG